MKAAIEVRGVSRLRLVPVAVALAAMLVALVWAPAASATSDPLAGGATNMHLKKGFKKKLNNINVKLVKWGSGKVRRNSVVALGVDGGSLDPTNGQGTVENSGGFKFKYKKRTVPITEIEVNTIKNTVFAKVANARMRFGFLSGNSYVRNGFGVDITSTKLKLSGKAAKRINNKLGMGKRKPLRGGRVMSNSWSGTQPSTVAVLPSGNAQLDGDIPTLVKLIGLGVAIDKIDPAVKQGLNTFLFPIGGGSLTPTASAGTLQTNGGVQLVQDLKVVVISMSLTNIWADMNTNVATAEVSIDSTDQNLAPTPGNVGRTSIANLDLSGATISSDPVNRLITVNNAKATIQAVTAATLNEVFAKGAPVFREGDSFGTFSFTAQTQ